MTMTTNMTPSDEKKPQRVTGAMERWLRTLLAKSDKRSPEGKPMVACQITWMTGTVANGVVTETDEPGIFNMLVEGQDQRGVRHVLDRVFDAAGIFLIDIPRELPVISSAGGGRIHLPG